MKKLKVNKQLIIRSIILITFLFCVIFLLNKYPIFKQLMGLVIISFIISYSMRPFQKLLTERGINRKISSVIVILTIVVFLVLIIAVLVPWIYNEGATFIDILGKIQGYYEGVTRSLVTVSENSFIKDIMSNFTDKIQVILVNMAETFIQEIIAITDDIFLMFTIPVLVYFFLSDGETISRGMMKYMPFKNKFLVKRMLKHIDKVMERYIITQFELCGIIGGLTFIALTLCGIRYAFVLSLLNAIFNIIPYFGPIIGAIPIVLISLIVSSKKAIVVTILLFIIQQVEGDIISPKIVGETVDSHPVTILLLLILGGSIGGIVGMILVIPLWVMGKIAVGELEYYLF